MPLEDFVAETVVRSTPQDRVNHVPDGRARLMFRANVDGRTELHVVGPRRRAVYKRITPCTAFVMIVFKPGGSYPFFGVPAAELVDQAMPLRDLWGTDAGELLDKLAAARSGQARLALLEQALVRRMHGPQAFQPSAAPVVREAVARLSTTGTTLGQVTRDLHLSERTLRRAFAEVVGLSPKRFERISRFQRALAGRERALTGQGRALAGRERALTGQGRAVTSRERALGTPKTSWAELAAASGYFDQAHLCADFREFARLSPTAFQRQAAMDGLRHECA